MKREKVDCIDCGTEFCPCKLAEAGECLLCSQLHGECFCDCLNWKGVCIYQELYNNGGKAKEGRKTYSLRVLDKREVEKGVLIIKFSSPHKLALDLVKPGSYVFIRTDDNNFFDIPISIMESDIENDEISIAVEIRGIKSKKLLDIKEGEDIVIRAPYWNGVFGQDNIKNTKNSAALILARGIGMAPMMPVIRRLKQNDNNVLVYIDKAPFNTNFAIDKLSDYNIEDREISLLEKGELTCECKRAIKEAIENNNVTLIHLAGADILTYKVIDYLDELKRDDILLSCCNNFKMCCGEGICGACTARFAGHKVKRFCKLQCDPRSIFERRRYI